MKTYKLAKKYVKYLWLVGAFLILMSLSAVMVIGNWEPISLGLLITGIVVIGVWAIFQGGNDLTSPSQAFWGRRSTQASTNAVAATVAVLAILGLINFLSVRYALRLDLTENQIFTLSPESQQVVRNLTKPIKVWIFDKNQYPQDRELLENYRRQGGNFSFEYADPNATPGLAKKFQVKEPGEVYLEYGEKRQFLQRVREVEPLSEEKLTNAIQQIKSDRTAKVYFLQGHGERSLDTVDAGLSEAVQALKDKSFKTEPLKLADRSQVPPDASVVVVAAPQQALFEGEVNALRDYLKRGGNLLLMVDTKTNEGASLDSLLQEWGVKIDNRLVINATEFQVGSFGPTAALVSSYGNHPITKDFKNRYSFYPFARPVDVVKAVPDVKSIPLMLTSEQTWAESNPDKLEFDAKSDRQGPLMLGVALTRKIESPSNSPPTPADPKSEKPTESRLVVIGNTDFAANGIFNQQINGDVFLNSISWLSQQNDRDLSIRAKEAKNRRIDMTLSQAVILALVAIVFVPFIGLTTAGFLWWRRR